MCLYISSLLLFTSVSIQQLGIIMVLIEDTILASNKARAFFMLAGYQFNPDHITQIIGLDPTHTDGSGAMSGMDKPMLSKWELSTDTITDEVDTYKLIDIIIKQVEPHKDKILQVIESHNLAPQITLVLTLSVDKDESSPDVGLGARAIRFLAEMGAFFNIQYELSERI